MSSIKESDTLPREAPCSQESDTFFKRLKQVDTGYVLDKERLSVVT